MDDVFAAALAHRFAAGEGYKVRAGVERVFAVQKGSMGLIIRTIGFDRARTKIGLANLAYNFKRFIWFEWQAAT